MVQWLRICLPMQRMQVRSLVREDPICPGAAKPGCHNYGACALEPESCHRRHRTEKPALQLESSLRYSVSFMVQFSQLYMTTGKSIALTLWTFAGKVMSLLLNILSRFVKAFLPRSKHLLSYFTNTQIIKQMWQTMDNCSFVEEMVAIMLLAYFYV